MKKIWIIVLLAGFLINTSNAQNLVPNPDFETFSGCPGFYSELYRAMPWFQPSLGTPDYLNACNTIIVNVPANFWGYQNAHSGVGYAAIFTCIIPEDTTLLYREYCEVPLNSPLQAGVQYFFTVYVSLGDSMNYATDALGVYFSIDTIKNNGGYFLSGIAPQVINTPGNFLTDKIGWTKISGKFIASGGERFLTIGNFKAPGSIDTISVQGGSLNIFQSDYHGGYYYLDDVCVSTDSLYCQTWTGINDALPAVITTYPNPVNEELSVKNDNNSKLFMMIDLLGQAVMTGQLINGLNKINVSSIAAGIYMIFLDHKFYSKVIVQH